MSKIMLHVPDSTLNAISLHLYEAAITLDFTHSHAILVSKLLRQMAKAWKAEMG